MSGKVNEAYAQTFAVRNGNGSPRTGLVSGDFTITVRDPANTTSDTPLAVEVGGGMYRFTIAAAFTLANGVGEYGWTIELTTAPFDLSSGTVSFFLRDTDDLAQPGDTMALTAAAIDAIWDELQAGHVTAGSFGVFLDALISSRSTLTAGQVETQLSGTHGAGSWATATSVGLTAAAVDAIWDELLSGHVIVGSAGEALAAAAAGGDPATIADAVWDELQAGHVTASTFGAFLNAAITSRATQAQILSDATPFAGANVDAAVSTRSTLTAPQVDTQLSGTHGAGSWATAAGFAVPGDAMTLTPAAEAAVAAAVGALSVDAGGGGQDLLEAMRSILSMALGRYVRTDVSATIRDFTFYQRDDVTPSYSMRITAGDGNGRARTSG